MTILVQREFRVVPADRVEFEHQRREGLWPVMLHFGPAAAAAAWQQRARIAPLTGGRVLLVGTDFGTPA